MLKIGFLGGGKMAQALANGMISGGKLLIMGEETEPIKIVLQ